MTSPDKGRKRRYTEDEEMIDAATLSSPDKQQHAMLWKKRTKTGISKKTPLDLKLATMDKDKLLQVLASLLETQPNLKHDMMTYIPAPTIPSTLAVLIDLEKKVWASFPYSKRGPQRDQYTFSRVRESLLELIDTIIQYSQHFVLSPSVFPTTCFTYLDQVTYFAHRLPIWDADDQNQLGRDLYNDLALFWKQAIQLTFDKISKGSTFNSDTIALWAKTLAHHNTLSGGGGGGGGGGAFDHVIQHFNQCFLLPPPKSTCHPTVPTSTHPSTFGSPIVGFTDFR